MTLTYELDLGYSQDSACQKLIFIDQRFQKLERYRQTDTQTDSTENITTLHFVGGKASAVQLSRMRQQLLGGQHW